MNQTQTQAEFQEEIENLNLGNIKFDTNSLEISLK